MNTMKAITATAITITTRIKPVDSAPWRPSSSMLASAEGSSATMPDRMMSEMPLPMPREVICSPSHIRNMVPPVSVMVVDIKKKMPGLDTTLPVPCRPMAMPYDWNAASTTVRYRVYWFMILRPDSPSFLSASSVGDTVVINWMMIEAEM